MDAERAHDLGLRLIAGGFVSAKQPQTAGLAGSAFGSPLPHPVGLAAGFDKNGVALEGLYALGFAFVEVGTVTPKPQPGNPRPRMWRVPSELAIVNRLGFNSAGATQVAKNLERNDTPIVYGINIGKNKATANEDAWMDYRDAARELRDFGNYFVVNVSSPNTPGLRQLQTRDDLLRIADAVRAAGVSKGIYVKVSPDHDDGSLNQIANVCREAGLAGVAATNTTIKHEHQEGGLSGAPLRSRATEVCSLMRRALGPGPEIIGVGGIFSGADLKERLDAGANACQIYTSFVYRGPGAVRDILDEYSALR